MKSVMLKSLIVASAITLSGSLFARDDRNMYPLSDALNTPAAKEKLDPNIALYFGKQRHPAIKESLGEWKTNKKTNAFNNHL